jgi:putative hemolysin
MQESEQNLTSDERTMINRVLELQHRTVGQVSRAMEMAVAVTTQTPMKDVLQLSKERNLTRFPVWQRDDGKRRIVGVVSLKTLLYSEDLDPARTAGDYVKPALFLKEEMRLEEALRQFQRSGQRMAIVVGRDQREVGFVTLQNVLDVLFGEVTL